MQQTHRRDSDRLLGNVIKGAVAGAIAVYVMDRIDWFAYNHEPDEVRERTKAVRPQGMDPAHVIADKIANMAGRELSHPQENPLGLAIHYSLGVLPGALYGALRDEVPALRMGRGSLMGLGLFLLQDEGLNSLVGVSARPGAYPWQAHARGLVGHLAYGLVTDTALTLMDYFKEHPQARHREQATLSVDNHRRTYGSRNPD